MNTRILLVDDDPFILEMLKVSMAALGHAFDTAMDGEAAKDSSGRASSPWFSRT